MERLNIGMEELPKIVRQRLVHRAKHDSSSAADALRGAVHPDANLLSAFAERSLTDDERAAVLGHLADCVECRELVSLAFPAAEVQAELGEGSSPAQGGRRWPGPPLWLGWRTLRWGVLAASVAVVMVGAFRSGILKWPASPNTANTARNTVAENRAVPSVISAPPAASTAPSARSDSVTGAPSADTRGVPVLRDKVAGEEKARSESVLQRPGAVGGVEKEMEKSLAPAPGPPPPTAKEKQHFAQYTLKAAPALREPNAGNKDRSARAANAVTANGRAAPPVSANEPSTTSRLAAITGGVTKTAPTERDLDKKLPPSSEAVEVQAQAVAPAKKADQLQESSAQNAQASSVGQAMAPPPQAPVAREQSQQGVASGLVPQTTQEVIVAPRQRARSMAARVPKMALPAGLPAYWSISASGRIERSRASHGPWSELHIDDTVKFQAVIAEGNDVWAGGTRGALFHSTDSGQHWARVKVGPNPADDQPVVTDAIVSLRFSDPEHGEVVTEAHERWTTTDGGAHWSLAH